MPIGTLSISPHQSGEFALTTSSLVLITMSGVPMLHPELSAYCFAGGMSAGFPRGAPLSAHLAIIAISSELSDGSFLYFWIPMFFSMYHGGMTPAFGPMPVRCLIERAQGRTSS
jgi:hypothetical protein